MHGDVAFAFAPDYNIPMIGDPGPFVISSTVGAGAPTEGQILGQGGETTATVGPLLVMAGAGFAFTLDAWDRALRIKPSFEYMREEIEISGVVRRAIRVQEPSPTLDDFRLVTLTAQKAPGKAVSSKKKELVQKSGTNQKKPDSKTASK